MMRTSTPRCGSVLQRCEKCLVRREIRLGDPDPCGGFLDREFVGCANRRHRPVAADRRKHSDEFLAVCARRAVVECLRKDAARSLPVGAEQLFESRDGRTLHDDMGIAPAALGFLGAGTPGRTSAGTPARAARVVLVDVEPAGERSLAVDDQDLAMVAVVHLQRVSAGQRIRRTERDHLDTGFAHSVEETLRRLPAADAVVKQPDCDALLCLVHQQFRECSADIVVADDVHLAVDVATRGVHGSKHRVVGGRSVDQQPHRVVFVERLVAQTLHQRDKAVCGFRIGCVGNCVRNEGSALRRTDLAVRTLNRDGTGLSRWLSLIQWRARNADCHQQPEPFQPRKKTEASLE